MKKMIIATAAVLALSGSAFAGSGHYGSDGVNQPAVSVDTQPTGSISDKHTSSTIRKLLNSSGDTQQPVTFGSDREHFGR